MVCGVCGVSCVCVTWSVLDILALVCSVCVCVTWNVLEILAMVCVCGVCEGCVWYLECFGDPSLGL